jgi:hypothetical protein
MVLSGGWAFEGVSEFGFRNSEAAVKGAANQGGDLGLAMTSDFAIRNWQFAFSPPAYHAIAA